LAEEAEEEDIAATTAASSEHGEPHQTTPLDTSVPILRGQAKKRAHVEVAAALIITFTPPSVKSMSHSHRATSSGHFSRVLVINDSFHGMLDFKAKNGKFPTSYDTLVSFLAEVNFDSVLISRFGFPRYCIMHSNSSNSCYRLE